MNGKNPTRETLSGALAAVALAAAIGANVYLTGDNGKGLLWTWLATMAAILILTGCIGKAISGNVTGVIESARNRVSLSRLQMLLWTVLILSAFVTAAAGNLHLEDNVAALDIAIPPELITAMGIAAISLAAAPAVLSLKAAPVGTNPALAAAPGISAGIHTRADRARSSWLDIFRGDEQGNCDTPDLSKIQQFLITVALVGTYGCMVGAMFIAGGKIEALPPLDQNFVWLLGVSHAGYLAYKAVPHPSANAGTPNPAAPAPAPARAVAPVPSPAPAVPPPPRAA